MLFSCIRYAKLLIVFLLFLDYKDLERWNHTIVSWNLHTDCSALFLSFWQTESTSRIIGMYSYCLGCVWSNYHVTVWRIVMLIIASLNFFWSCLVFLLFFNVPQLSSVQLLSHVRLFATPWTSARQAFLSITNYRSPPKPTSIESVMPSNHLVLCCPLLLFLFSSIRVFSNESGLCIKWPKYWHFNFNISPFNEHPGLISIRMDWLDLLAVQGTLKSLLQHHSSKASILRRSAFFIVQLSHLYMTTGKPIALTRRTFVGKVMSLLFNVPSRLVITLLPRSKCLFISWLQSPSAVILEPIKIKSATVSPSICHEVMGPDAMILVFWMLRFKQTFSLSSFTFIKRFFSSSSLSAISVVWSAYLRLLIFLQAVLIPACASSSPAFLMMYSAYKLNEQGDNIQAWHTSFPIWNQSVCSMFISNCCFLTCIQVSQETGQVPKFLNCFSYNLVKTKT